jgi:hypothetical protein
VGGAALFVVRDGGLVEILYERVAGIDVHKAQVTVTVRMPGGPGQARREKTRRFKTFYADRYGTTARPPAPDPTHSGDAVPPGPEPPTARSGRVTTVHRPLPRKSLSRVTIAHASTASA